MMMMMMVIIMMTMISFVAIPLQVGHRILHEWLWDYHKYHHSITTPTAVSTVCIDPLDATIQAAIPRVVAVPWCSRILSIKKPWLVFPLKITLVFGLMIEYSFETTWACWTWWLVLLNLEVVFIMNTRGFTIGCWFCWTFKFFLHFKCISNQEISFERGICQPAGTNLRGFWYNAIGWDDMK